MNWIKAKDIPKDWEGTHKLAYSDLHGVYFSFVMPGFSREDRHCDGFWFAEMPKPPK